MGVEHAVREGAKPGGLIHSQWLWHAQRGDRGCCGRQCAEVRPSESRRVCMENDMERGGMQWGRVVGCPRLIGNSGGTEEGGGGGGGRRKGGGAEVKRLSSRGVGGRGKTCESHRGDSTLCCICVVVLCAVRKSRYRWGHATRGSHVGPCTLK